MTTSAVTTLDPDGWVQCYSDHAHDVEQVGCCGMCGSTEVNVIGHILKGFDRVTGHDPVVASQMVLDGGATIFDGVLLDTFTASAILAVERALRSPAAKQKLRAMSLTTAATVCFQLIGRSA